VHPLDVGTTWVYEVSDHGTASGTRTRQVLGQSPLVGALHAVAVSSRYSNYPGVGPTANVSYVSADDGRVLQHAVRFGLDATFLEPAAPLYEFPVRVGQSWSYRGTLGEASVTLDVRLVGIEDVEVGGRTFAECAHYRSSQRVDPPDARGDEEVYEEWTCPDVGPVRSRDVVEARGLDISEELVSFHGPAGNWDADPPGPPSGAETALPGTTIGLSPARDHVLRDGEVTPELAWSDLRSEQTSFGPVGDGDRYVLGEYDGQVSAVDRTDGSVLWRVRLRGPVAAAPAMAGDLVLVADADRTLWALDLADGHARWAHGLGDVVSASVAVAADAVVVATDDDRLAALALSNGTQRWRTTLPAPAAAAPAVAGGLVVVADRAGTVAAYDIESGDEAWSFGLEGVTAAGPAIGDDTVLLADDAGTIVALDLESGRSRWQAATHYYPEGGFAIGEGRVVVGASNSRLLAYDLTSGDRLWSVGHRRFRAAPVIVGDQVVTASREGVVQVRDAASGALDREWALPLPAEVKRDVTADLAVAGDALVVSAYLTAPGLSAGMWAYALAKDRPRPPGVGFEVRARTVELPLESPAVLTQGSLFAATWQGLLVRVPPGGAATEVFTAPGGQVPGVAAEGDLVVAQRDDEFVGLGSDGRELWTAPAAPPFVGTIPAISGESVFLPLPGVGLAALDRTGRQRWMAPITSTLGSTTPLPLPGGDVVHGVGTVARYDGATGEAVWSVPDAVVFSPMASADGLVFADLARNEHPSGLAAIDAATGEIVWMQPSDAQPVLLGPAAGQGVVVRADTTGLVVGLDASTGDRLWSVQAESPLAGTPVVVGGRVFLVEQGHQDDLNQRASRVRVHDVRTGDFLGSYEPPDSPISTRPGVGVTPEGHLLVPATGGDGIWVLELVATEGSR
jgi:outer membrane protein assembly factor BamB